jgi:hypothetical protein
VPNNRAKDPDTQGREMVFGLAVLIVLFVSALCLVGYVAEFLRDPWWGPRMVWSLICRLLGL